MPKKSAKTEEEPKKGEGLIAKVDLIQAKVPGAKSAAKEGKNAEALTIPLHFNLPIDKPSVYATNIIVQAADLEIILSFYEAQPPMLQGSPEEVAAALQREGVRADCVAKVTIAKARFPNFVKAMQGVLSELTEKAKK